MSTANGTADRFLLNDTWAKVESVEFTNYEVAYTSIPVTAETTDVLFRVETGALQNAGNFTLTNLQFIVVPFY